MAAEAGAPTDQIRSTVGEVQQLLGDRFTDLAEDLNAVEAITEALKVFRPPRQVTRSASCVPRARLTRDPGCGR